MRISRKKRPQKPVIPFYRVNDKIQNPQVRLLDADGKNIGVMPTADALRRAREAEMDLVEINPKAEPPVCQITDFARFKYQKEKEVKRQKTNSRVSEVKGVRLSIRISDHDMGVRVEQAKKFLERGDKLKPEIILRGRENAKADLAFGTIEQFFQQMSAHFPVQFEQAASRQANKVTALISRK